MPMVSIVNRSSGLRDGIGTGAGRPTRIPPAVGTVEPLVDAES
jgi:hypothetical protein